jgi:hypothetical protein
MEDILMAGDWLPITTDITTRREVLVLSSETGLTRHAVVGWLVEFWGWASAETADGRLRNVSVATLVALFGLQEVFFRCLCTQGWMSEDGNDLIIHNWDRWLSNGAKTRLGNALRQKEYRSKRCKSVATNVATKPLPEKSTVENNIIPPKSPKGDRRARSKKDGGVHFETWWKMYPRKEGKGKAEDAWILAGEKIRTKKGWDSKQTVAFLLDRVTVYAASPRAKDSDRSKIPHPSTWLNHGRYDDDPETWLTPLTDARPEKESLGPVAATQPDARDLEL